MMGREFGESPECAEAGMWGSQSGLGCEAFHGALK